MYALLHELDAEARKDGSVVLLHSRVAAVLQTLSTVLKALAGTWGARLEQVRPLLALGAGLVTCIAENPGWATMVSSVKLPVCLQRCIVFRRVPAWQWQWTNLLCLGSAT
jgi:hypothetical protein